MKGVLWFLTLFFFGVFIISLESDVWEFYLTIFLANLALLVYSHKFHRK